MAEAAKKPVTDAAGSSLPTPDDLFVFFESLRQQGYHIDAGQIAAAERLLLDAHSAGSESDAACRLKFRLVPVIAKTPEEQEDVYRRFDRWRGSPAPQTTAPGAEGARRHSRRLIITVAVAACVGLGTLATWYFWPSPPPSPEETTAPTPTAKPEKAHDLLPERLMIMEEVISPFYDGTKAVLIAMPMLAFATLLVLRWRRQAVWLSRGFAVLDGELATVPLPVKLSQMLFAGAEFRNSAQDLRKHHYRRRDS